MKKISQILMMALVLVFIVSGCGLLPKGTGEESKTSDSKNSSQSSNSSNSSQAMPAKETYPEITFETKYFTFDEVPARGSGGIWYYTKEQHAGNLDKQFTWDQNDVILIQASDKKLYGKKLIPTAIEKKADDLINIKVNIADYTYSDPGIPSMYKEYPARCFIVIPKGSINSKKAKFSITSETGEKITVQ
ncbi:hypothetical protein [Thermoflavimicrobium dichotomicum]|uniref:Lipoprotein n=1 Tax=Thermoflavimicrobium dichotomicum TaxID=46223 RepID=A0A1I3TRP9_9BACL|nr:hypothetical protein [Thermoflavimicrobium dichotomicum]SFJ73272.1 hypothetical protein SAMN05421852_11938 [Thermoflavimicrobium dichotomicum]